MQLVVVSSFNLALTFNGHIFSLLIVYFSIITLNKGNVGTHHLNNRILLFVCNRKVIYYHYITLPSIQGRGNDFFLGGGAKVLICLVIAKF